MDFWKWKKGVKKNRSKSCFWAKEFLEIISLNANVFLNVVLIKKETCCRLANKLNDITFNIRKQPPDSVTGRVASGHAVKNIWKFKKFLKKFYKKFFNLRVEMGWVNLS